MKVNRTLATALLALMAAGAMSQEIGSSIAPANKTAASGQVATQAPISVAEAQGKAAKPVKRSDWYHAYNRHRAHAPADAASAA